jgi:PAS domain-containing protein
LRGPMHEKEIQSGGSGIIKRSGAEDSGYLLLFQAVADGMLLATAEGDILDANPEACALLGRAREEVVTAGRDLRHLGPPARDRYGRAARGRPVQG